MPSRASLGNAFVSRAQHCHHLVPPGLIHRFSGAQDTISLAGGLPPPEAFPLETITASTTGGLQLHLGAEGQQVVACTCAALGSGQVLGMTSCTWAMSFTSVTEPCFLVSQQVQHWAALRKPLCVNKGLLLCLR